MKGLKPSILIAIILPSCLLFILPSISSCRSGKSPTEPGLAYERRMDFEPAPNSKHFQIIPVAPEEMFSAEGYSPICEDSKPIFIVEIYAPSEGRLTTVSDVKVSTTIDGKIVPHEICPTTGTVTFSPIVPLRGGRHNVAVHLTLDGNAYPPAIGSWDFDVYNEAPDISLVMYDPSTMRLMVLFNRPVPEAQIKDIPRWNINLEPFATSAEAQAGLMGAIITADHNLEDHKSSPDPVVLEFRSKVGISEFILFRGKNEREGDRSAQTECDCSPVESDDFTPFPESQVNPHQSIENENNAWAYRFELESNHCDLLIPSEFEYSTVEQTYAPWDPSDCYSSYMRSSGQSHLAGGASSPFFGFIVSPDVWDHTIRFSYNNRSSISLDIYADNDCDDEYETVVSYNEVNFTVNADLLDPAVSFGPYILTGWQAAREIEELVSDPGDDRFYYGGFGPPTLEEFIELLRTIWADNLFVMAAGADPGGNLGPPCPLSLDAYHDGMFCENMPPFVSLAFLLRRDASPLGTPPGEEPGGDELIPWPDHIHYPDGYPADGNAFNEEEYALWDITDFIDEICASGETGFSMRVRVTDHAGNWTRSEFIEELPPGSEEDPEVTVQAIKFIDDDEYPDYSYIFCGDNEAWATYNPIPGQERSIIHRRFAGRYDIDPSITLFVALLTRVAPPNFPPTLQHPDIIVTSTESKYSNPTDDARTCISPMFIYVADENRHERLCDIFGANPDDPCLGFYIAEIIVTDAPGLVIHPNKLYISHRDDGISSHSDAPDLFRLAANPTEGNDFFADVASVRYGKNRMSGYHCGLCDDAYMLEDLIDGWQGDVKPENISSIFYPIEGSPPEDLGFNYCWYNFDEALRTGGFEVAFAIAFNKYAETAVQSGADIIFVASHAMRNEITQETEYLPALEEFSHNYQNYQPGENYLQDNPNIACLLEDSIIVPAGAVISDISYMHNDPSPAWADARIWQNMKVLFPPISEVETEHLILDVCGQLSGTLDSNISPFKAAFDLVTYSTYARSVSSYDWKSYGRFLYMVDDFNNRLIAHNGPDENLYPDGSSLPDILRNDNQNAAWAWMESHCHFIRIHKNEFSNLERINFTEKYKKAFYPCCYFFFARSLTSFSQDSALLLFIGHDRVDDQYYINGHVQEGG